MDHRYITSQHDGQVYGFDYNRYPDRERPAFAQTLASPVARVFDIISFWRSPGNTPDLTALPQPPPPPEDATTQRRRTDHVFLNQTEAGSWYALPGERYPLVLEAPEALVCKLDPLELPPWEMMDEAQISEALVGIHRLPGRDAEPPEISFPLLPAPTPTPDEPEGFDLNPPAGDILEPVKPLPTGYLQKMMRIPEDRVRQGNRSREQPLAILICFVCLLAFQKDLRRWWNSTSEERHLHQPSSGDQEDRREL